MSDSAAAGLCPNCWRSAASGGVPDAVSGPVGEPCGRCHDHVFIPREDVHAGRSDPYRRLGLRLVPESSDDGAAYVPERLIGEGSFGAVYRARAWPSGEVCAVKLLRQAGARVPPDVERYVAELFEREAAVLRRLQEPEPHPHIVGFRDLFTSATDGDRYLVMDFVSDSKELAELLRRAPSGLPPADVAWMIDQTLAALAHAHDRTIIHRDLKPGNVLVAAHGTDEERIVVIDFGLARAAGGTRSLGSIGPAQGSLRHAYGTPEFGAPEQIAARVSLQRDLEEAQREPGEDGRQQARQRALARYAGAVRPAADVYAVGVMTVALLSGQQPYRKLRDSDVVRAVYDGLPPFDDGAWKRVERAAPALVPVLRRAMAREPAERPATAGALREAFQCAVGADTTVHHALSRTRRALADAEERAGHAAKRFAEEAAARAEADERVDAARKELEAERATARTAASRAKREIGAARARAEAADQRAEREAERNATISAENQQLRERLGADVEAAAALQREVRNAIASLQGALGEGDAAGTTPRRGAWWQAPALVIVAALVGVGAFLALQTFSAAGGCGTGDGARPDVVQRRDAGQARERDVVQADSPAPEYRRAVSPGPAPPAPPAPERDAASDTGAEAQAIGAATVVCPPRRTLVRRPGLPPTGLCVDEHEVSVGAMQAWLESVEMERVVWAEPSDGPLRQGCTRGRGPYLAANCVGPETAARYCAAYRWRAGRLPTLDEWRHIACPDAAEEDERCCPWKADGAPDCGKAVFQGTGDGCRALDGPQSVFEPKAGATAESVLNLAGNVAEWVTVESADGQTEYRYVGGSWRDTDAASMCGPWEARPVDLETFPYLDTVGFRCVSEPRAPVPAVR